MTRIAAVFLILFGCQAVAAEITTECPLVNPFDGTRLGGAASSEDTPEYPALTKLIRRGSWWHYTNVLEKWGAREATLECQYSGQNLILKIPGLLLRCEWQAHYVPKPKPVKLNSGGPYNTVFERIWCTSRE